MGSHGTAGTETCGGGCRDCGGGRADSLRGGGCGAEATGARGSSQVVVPSSSLMKYGRPVLSCHRLQPGGSGGENARRLEPAAGGGEALRFMLMREKRLNEHWKKTTMEEGEIAVESAGAGGSSKQDASWPGASLDANFKNWRMKQRLSQQKETLLYSSLPQVIHNNRNGKSPFHPRGWWNQFR